MIVIRKFIMASVGSFAIISSAYAQYIPNEFQHFYVYESREILFVLPNDNAFKGIASANYYGVRDIQNKKGLYNALIVSGIKKDRAENVISSIVDNNNGKDGVKTTYSYNEGILEVEVKSDYMDEAKEEADYTTLKPDNSALIVNNRFYGNYYDNSLSGTLNSNALMGLGAGYIEADVSLSGSNGSGNDFDANSLKYEHNFNSVAFQLGYDAYGVERSNSTSYLDYSNSRDNYYVSFSSSDNLLATDDTQAKKLYFDIKNSGTVDVVRDGRTLYSQSYTKGQHSISYNNLPRGNYNVELVIHADGYSEERIIRRINNNVAKTSHKGYDFNLTLRQAEYDDGDDIDTLIYGDASFTKALFHESLVLGISSRSDGHSADTGVFANYFGTFFGAMGYYNQMKQGLYYNGSVNVAGLNFDYENFNIDREGTVSPLVLAVYGQESFEQTTVSYSFPLGFSNVSFYGSKLHREGEVGDNQAFDNTNLAVAYQTNIFGDVALDVGYSLTVNDERHEDRDGIFSVNISIPLGDDHMTYMTGYEASSRNHGRVTNSLSYQDADLDVLSGVDTSGGFAVNNYLDGQQSESAVNGYLNMQNDEFYSSGYASLSNQSNNNVSLTLESTSVLLDKGIYQTRENSPSYVVINSDVSGKELEGKEEDLGILDTQVNYGRHSNELIEGEKTVVGLNEFSTYKFIIDDEISGYRASDNRHNVPEMMFSYPGSVYVMSNKVEPVVTFLSYFEDFNQEPLNDVKCIGEGCVSISQVGEGIYSLSLINDKPFKVASNGEYCYVEPGTIESNQAKSQCFPTIEMDDNGMQLVSSGLGEKNDTIYYLGIMDGDIPIDVVAESKKVNIEYIKYNFANNIHLFAKTNKKVSSKNSSLINIAQREIFEELQLYVRNNSEHNRFARK